MDVREYARHADAATREILRCIQICCEQGCTTQPDHPVPMHTKKLLGRFVRAIFDLENSVGVLKRRDKQREKEAAEREAARDKTEDCVIMTVDPNFVPPPRVPGESGEHYRERINRAQSGRRPL